MTSFISDSESESVDNIFKGNNYSQVHLKIEKNKIVLILPSVEEKIKGNDDWSILWYDLKCRLNAIVPSWQPNTKVDLIAGDRLLDGRQLQTIAEALLEVKLNLSCVSTSRRQTAVAAAIAGYSVLQKSPQDSLITTKESNITEEPLYLSTTLRSGTEIRHPGNIIVVGDLNPGATLIAGGDILIWGCLRGVASAGSFGNRKSIVMALKMNATQLRIADLVARTPEQQPEEFEAEVAYITATGIRIAKALNFFKSHSFSEESDSWTD